MAFDQAGEGGLRRRLNLAREYDPQMAETAAILNVNAGTLMQYLNDPDYVLSSEDYNQIISYLWLLPMFRHTRDSHANYSVTFSEKPEWTEQDIDTFEVSEVAISVVCFVYDGNYPDRIASAGPFGLDTYTVQQAIDIATDGDTERLVTVVEYIPLVEYPYPSNL